MAEAAVLQAKATSENAQAQAERRRKLSDLAESIEDRQTYEANALATKAQHQQAIAQRDRAKVNLDRTTIRSPVNGWVTNLLARLGDYASVGTNVISIVDADSYWVDAYFEETQLASVHEGDPAEIKLRGYSQIVRGEVAGVARGINVSNAQPKQQGLADLLFDKQRAFGYACRVWTNSGVAMSPVQADRSPNTVALFSGHMIDASDRKTPRFRPDKERVAAAAIAQTLAEIGVTRGDLAICGGACGGDLLFAEACLARDMALKLYIPFDEPTFLANSVDFADADWHDRYLAVKSRAKLHVMPDELGPLQAGENPYERNNRWMLESAARFGGKKIAFIALWNGQGGDGPGGTQHFMDDARGKTERIYWLDTRKLWD